MRVLLHSIVESLDILLVEESQDMLLKLTAALAGDDLYQSNLFVDCFLNDGSERSVNIPAPVVDLVQVELEFHNRGSTPPVGQRAPAFGNDRFAELGSSIDRAPAVFDLQKSAGPSRIAPVEVAPIGITRA
jgi:hypothetical protein